jgi:phosphoribosylaminoimidazole carboxylase (NCAIR synthetase)
MIMVRKVGVIGGGQLAWMMASAATKLDVELVVQTPSSNDPAVSIATHTVFAPIADASARSSPLKTNLLILKRYSSWNSKAFVSILGYARLHRC